MHSKTLRKTVTVLFFIILATCIALFVEILGEKAYIDWMKKPTDKAFGWGFLVGIILFYALPLCLLISTFLFFKKRILFWIPYIILFVYAIDESFIGSWTHPLRGTLLLLSISAGYLSSFSCLYFYQKRRDNKITDS
ncbi:hypothetical protein RCZ04_10060 [Capnocytophaga sp. HP1101]